MHGGGSSAASSYSAWSGSFGEEIANIKFIFPSSTITGGVWYETYKEGSISNCDFGLFSECAYNLDDMKKSGKQIKTIIDNEITGGITASNIYMSGYSQGARMVWHTAFGQLT
jgi:predicted esterase